MTDHARPVERAVFDVRFGDGDIETVVSALERYRNEDGGFGHGLEPDKLVPDSQPLDVEIGLERLASVGADAADMVGAACDWLASIAAPSGAVPVLLPSIDGHPMAGHWTMTTTYAPAVNPTAAIAAHAHILGVDHAWVVSATEYCLGEVEAGRLPDEAHHLLCLAKLVEAVPDRARASAAAERLAAAVPNAGYFKPEPGDGYGLTPLHFCPTPDASATAWFEERQLADHLDALEDEQQPDGGWPVAWEPPGEASVVAWRGILTLAAVGTLTAYGRGG